jgi:hypothetical protein
MKCGTRFSAVYPDPDHKITRLSLLVLLSYRRKQGPNVIQW